jgi:hypothetical protein
MSITRRLTKNIIVYDVNPLAKLLKDEYHVESIELHKWTFPKDNYNFAIVNYNYPYNFPKDNYNFAIVNYNYGLSKEYNENSETYKKIIEMIKE